MAMVMEKLVSALPFGTEKAGNQGDAPVISVISPVYRAEKIVDELVNRLRNELVKLGEPFEILLVEDGSPDNSWAKICANCALDQRVKGIRLSRNYGQHFAISAGLAEAKGAYVAVIDCDLQDDPKELGRLLDKAKEGYDIVYTIKLARAHSLGKNVVARLFFTLFNFLTDSQVATSKVGSYSLLSRRVVNAFGRIQDVHRHYLMVLRTLGFQSASIEVEHKPRLEGKSSYTLSKLIKHAIDGIASQSNKLLNFSIIIGVLYFFVSFLAASYLVIMYFLHGYKEGWASMIVLLLVSTGFILVSLGVVGLYIGKIFDQVRQRPIYIIEERVNLDPQQRP
jgi:polyisoprenyl-phosphate glycosyltransferase